jgi:hypothetical protein
MSWPSSASTSTRALAGVGAQGDAHRLDDDRVEVHRLDRKRRDSGRF